MRREDLFIAIGMVDDQRLARCEKQVNPSEVNLREESKMKYGVRKLWLIAAIIALMLLLMGSAIAAIVTMRVNDVKTFIQGGETKEGEKVEFEKVQDVFIELGFYYPQEIPDGYTMTFVSDGAPYQNQNIIYENDAGDEIWYWIYIGDPASKVEIYDIVSKTDVSINGQDGILYEQVGSHRTLVWVNEAQGYGFALESNDTAVDLVAMAKSTAKGEKLVPTRSESTVKAIEELGDYYPAYLPEGYEEQGTMGCPLDEGGGWYSYVRKWIVNKEENTQIYFEYETYAIDTNSGYADDAITICSFFIPGCKILENKVPAEEVIINGMFGLAAENDIAWADPENHTVYHLYSEDVTDAELLKVAQSMVKK